MPVAVTVSVVAAPFLIITEAGPLVILGGSMTVTVAVFESASPAELWALTQKRVVVVNAAVVWLAEDAPLIGVEVSPRFPIYHWKVGDVPVTVTARVVFEPLLMETDAG